MMKLILLLLGILFELFNGAVGSSEARSLTGKFLRKGLWLFHQINLSYSLWRALLGKHSIRLPLQWRPEVPLHGW
jgi:hypothetical protein